MSSTFLCRQAIGNYVKNEEQNRRVCNLFLKRAQSNNLTLRSNWFYGLERLQERDAVAAGSMVGGLF